jgi:hypothetical protein
VYLKRVPHPVSLMIVGGLLLPHGQQRRLPPAHHDVDLGRLFDQRPRLFTVGRALRSQPISARRCF